jgi:hypothetical protein
MPVPDNSNVMAISGIKTLLTMGLFVSAVSARAQEPIEPIESEVDIEARTPIRKVVKTEDGQYFVAGGFCGLTEEEKDTLWTTVLGRLTGEYPEHSKYCERKISTTSKSFVVIDGICRAYVRCEKIVDGVEILKGYFVVEVDEKTLEVKGFTDVPW